jgi:hypothetical protein
MVDTSCNAIVKRISVRRRRNAGDQPIISFAHLMLFFPRAAAFSIPNLTSTATARILVLFASLYDNI